MKYFQLQSTLASGKKSLNLRESTASFYLAGPKAKPYIEPSFEKIIFETEKPTLILVSAVGATGKSALAMQLSRDTSLPILDLAKHKPVGDNTLTGILTSAYDMSDIGTIFQGLSTGTYGVIIDGIDEGRSKTTGKAFDAFLDDIVKLCKTSKAATFVLLGRTTILDDCWEYLSKHGVETALITISPFDTEGAKKYIDAFTDGLSSAYEKQYRETRDFIISKLTTAFLSKHQGKSEEFLSFIGYPPVLDAIVTLLNEEKNYYKLLEEVGKDVGSNVEVRLLHRITTYILERERQQKVLPNIVQPLVEDLPGDVRSSAMSNSFKIEEQSARLVAYCLGRQLTLSQISVPVVNEKYEAQLATWLPEHPFISGRDFRNAVFEAVALSVLMTSGKKEYEEIVSMYLSSRKHSYHLVYMLDTMSADKRLSIAYLNAVLSSAMEFRSVHATVELHVDGPDRNDVQRAKEARDIDIEVEIFLGDSQESGKTFAFKSQVTSETSVQVGPRLGGAFITVPCDVVLYGSQELELTAPVEINARNIQINAKALIARPTGRKSDQNEIILEAQRLKSSIEVINTSGSSLDFVIEDRTGLLYPVIQHVTQATRLPPDDLLQQKYFRLKRILLEFRSHSKGSLAKYRYKIEHERVLKNEVGKAVLNKLVTDKILILKGNLYHLDPTKLNDHLGVSWQDLRKGQTPDSFIAYLRTIGR